jgi:hypothetical protein
MDFAHTMDATGVEKNTLGRRRFAGINMGNDADIPCPLNWIIYTHKKFP